MRDKNSITSTVAERSALSTIIAILGRSAIYTKKEAVWKDVIWV
jgi:hypothetical protein